MTPKHAARIITLAGWGFILFGVVFVTIAFSSLDGIARAIISGFDWTGEAAGEPLTRNSRWFGGIMSGVCAGLGALFAFVVAPLLSNPNAAARQVAKRGGLIALSLWYVIDTAGSLAAGVPSNAAMNTIFLIMLAGPLLMVKFETP